MDTDLEENESIHETRRTVRIVAIVLLIVLAAASVLAIRHIGGTRQLTVHPQTDDQVHVSLGMLKYHIADGRTEQRTDSTVTSLRDFLTRTGKKDVQLGCTSTYYNVIAVSDDEMQVLLNYGCDYPNARMFALRIGDTWKLVSPTNQFNQFGIPRCAYVEQYAISRDVAPVCANDVAMGVGQAYTTR